MEQNTTEYQLNILRNTQMVQRKQLEELYPYINWDKMPFSSYSDFFKLKNIIDDCGEVWTNAYGRSNEETEDTRKYLKDYSGNGRDIELFNFGYSKQSGFNGYVQDFRGFEPISGIQATVTENRINITNTSESGTWIIGMALSKYVNKEWRLYVENEDGNTNATIQFYSVGNTDIMSVPLQGGLNIIPAQSFASQTRVVFSIPVGATFTFTQLPNYPGAIVGDGVDDYGQCVKDFALPDDYTVVAMREILNGGPSGIINKTRATSQGAFIFEYAGSQSYSYGDNFSDLSAPKLFSYQTKASYNGTVLTPGTGTDTADDKLLIFRLRDGTSNYISAALYSFGIFNRTLTADELRTVENCMYAEWICMTRKLEDIEYYDILDARFRSNDEAADKRNKWVGRLGKLHMTLHNYGFAGMSGWDGYPINWESWNNVVIPQQGGLIEASKSIIKVKNFGAYPAWSITSNSEIASIPEMRIKISGLKTGASLFFIKQVSDTRTNLMTATRDGIYTVPADTSAPDYYAIYCNGYSANEDADLTIELIPEYGGALVSDGVDDYAVSDEVIDEEIGGFVWHGEVLTAGYAFSTSWGANHVFMYKDSVGSIHYGGKTSQSEIVISDDVQILGYLKEPAIPNNVLMITPKLGSTYDYSNAALYQLRLIKNQPTDIQLEAIKWQCRKEHDDYLIQKGWYLPQSLEETTN